MMVVSYIDAHCIESRRNDFYNASALIGAFFQILDFVSAVFFCILLFAYSYFFSFISSAVFLIVPMILSLVQLFSAVQHWRAMEQDMVTTWLRDYNQWLYVLSVLTGSAFTASQICRSSMFGLPQMGLPLCRWNIFGFYSKKLWITVLLQVNCLYPHFNTFWTRPDFARDVRSECGSNGDPTLLPGPVRMEFDYLWSNDIRCSLDHIKYDGYLQAKSFHKKYDLCFVAF